MTIDRITVRADQLGGVPCIRGLRIPVSVVVALMARGLSDAQILDEYPALEPEDLRQALRDQFDGDDTWHQQWNLMNRWRNAIAHAAREPAETLTLTSVREWRRVVGRVVAALDAILYRELKRLLRRTPWQT